MAAVSRGQTYKRFAPVPIIAALLLATLVCAQKRRAMSPQILSAKTVYFMNQTQSTAVGMKALAELKKWGRFQVVENRQQADLILLLSMDPYRQGEDIQKGNLDDGDESRIPKWDRQRQTQYAYLTVVDPQSGTDLWSAEHLWGGLITGFNSVGERLVKELEREAK